MSDTTDFRMNQIKDVMARMAGDRRDPREDRIKALEEIKDLCQVTIDELNEETQ